MPIGACSLPCPQVDIPIDAMFTVSMIVGFGPEGYVEAARDTTPEVVPVLAKWLTAPPRGRLGTFGPDDIIPHALAVLYVLTKNSACARARVRYVGARLCGACARARGCATRVCAFTCADAQKDYLVEARGLEGLAACVRSANPVIVGGACGVISNVAEITSTCALCAGGGWVVLCFCAVLIDLI